MSVIFGFPCSRFLLVTHRLYSNGLRGEMRDRETLPYGQRMARGQRVRKSRRLQPAKHQLLLSRCTLWQIGKFEIFRNTDHNDHAACGVKVTESNNLKPMGIRTDDGKHICRYQHTDGTEALSSFRVCSVFALNSKLIAGRWIPKWHTRDRMGIDLGPSPSLVPQHGAIVATILRRF
jgi:hypothetical protein